MTPPETIGSTLGAVAAALERAGFDEARRRARQLLALALGLPLAEVFAGTGQVITDDEGERIAKILRRALAYEPLSRIAGTREFWGLEFALSPETLDPRPETETVVEAVLGRLSERNRDYRFLDLGTGTGCLLLALLSEYPAATGVGVDHAFGAAVAARRNAERLGLAKRARLLVGNWTSAINGRFDAIVTNPPYIETAALPDLPREVRDYDPSSALDGGIDGLVAYRAIADNLSGHLVPGGLFACEIGAGQESAAVGIISDGGLVIDDVVPDLAGIPRCIVARRRP